ncbi:hypothetical protein ABIA96_006583 [Bradyrhizobium sp. LB11.1]
MCRRGFVAARRSILRPQWGYPYRIRVSARRQLCRAVLDLSPSWSRTAAPWVSLPERQRFQGWIGANCPEAEVEFGHTRPLPLSGRSRACPRPLRLSRFFPRREQRGERNARDERTRRKSQYVTACQEISRGRSRRPHRHDRQPIIPPPVDLEGGPKVQSGCRLSATADRRAWPGCWPDAYTIPHR